MSRHETDSSRVFTIFQACTKDVFLQHEGLIKRIKRERGFMPTRKSRKKGDENPVVVGLNGPVVAVPMPVNVASIKGGQRDAAV